MLACQSPGRCPAGQAEPQPD